MIDGGDSLGVEHGPIVVCEPIPDAGPLQQGDVFEWLRLGSHQVDVAGVIVTADCDLAFSKHRGRLSYVPVVPLLEYVRLVHAPRRLGKVKKVKTQEALDALSRVGRPLEDIAALNYWIETSGVAGIVEQLGLQGADALKVGGALESYQLLVRAVDHYDLDAQQVAAGKDFVTLLRRVTAELPGDAFFIDALHEDCRGGFIAQLRDISQLPDSAIALDVAGLGVEQVQAKRVSRVKAPYRYRLTQMLAGVFADIGLPDQHSECSRAAAESLAQEYGKGSQKQ